MSRVGAEQSDRAVVLVTHRLEEIPQGFDHVAIMGRITGSEADATPTMSQATIRLRAPSCTRVIWNTVSLRNGLSEVFGLELEVTHANGRWSAYAR